jgi:hypothetical protein
MQAPVGLAGIGSHSVPSLARKELGVKARARYISSYASTSASVQGRYISGSSRRTLSDLRPRRLNILGKEMLSL